VAQPATDRVESAGHPLSSGPDREQTSLGRAGGVTSGSGGRETRSRRDQMVGIRFGVPNTRRSQDTEPGASQSWPVRHQARPRV